MSHFLNYNEIDPSKPLTLRDAYAAIKKLNEQISDQNAPAHLVSQENLRNRLLTALILGCHCLIEGHPGLAKTLASELLGKRSGLAFRRAQFTPDMMPSDLLYSDRITVDKATGKTEVERILGPIFANIFLADEINRASPKIQAAMLEATQERRVTLLRGERLIIRPKLPYDEAQLLMDYGPYFGVKKKFDPTTHDGQLFMALATMNPLEQEGVFPLSEAQLDRFAFKLIVEYPEVNVFDQISFFAFDRPSAEGAGPTGEEHVRTLYFFSALRDLLVGPAAMKRWLADQNKSLREKLHAFVQFSHLGYAPSSNGGGHWAPDAMQIKSSAIDGARELLKKLRGGSHPELTGVAERLDKELKNDKYPEVTYGASPRALINLIRAAHVQAFLNGPIDGEFQGPRWNDFDAVAPDIMRHRIRVAASSSAMGMGPQDVVKKLCKAFLGA